VIVVVVVNVVGDGDELNDASSERADGHEPICTQSEPHLRVRPFAPRRGPSTPPQWNRPLRNGRSPWSRTIPRRTTSARSARSHGGAARRLVSARRPAMHRQPLLRVFRASGRREVEREGAHREHVPRRGERRVR
jgi:hypothetical protein